MFYLFLGGDSLLKLFTRKLLNLVIEELTEVLFDVIYLESPPLEVAAVCKFYCWLALLVRILLLLTINLLYEMSIVLFLKLWLLRLLILYSLSSTAFSNLEADSLRSCNVVNLMLHILLLECLLGGSKRPFLLKGDRELDSDESLSLLV